MLLRDNRRIFVSVLRGKFIKQLKEIHFYVNISEYSLLHYVYFLPGLWPFFGIQKEAEIF